MESKIAITDRLRREGRWEEACLCRDDERLMFELLIDLTGTDPSTDDEELWININLLSVAQRHREIGIRMAMGAERTKVLGMILRQGGGLALIGLVVGVVGSLLLTRLLSSQLYGVSTTDPRAFVVAPLFLAGVAILACYLPALRATRVDPVSALRED